MDGDFVADGIAQNGITDYVKLNYYEGNDNKIVAELETNNMDYPNGRRIEWIYDNGENRLRNSDVLSEKVIPSNPLSNEPQFLQTSYTYDPVFGGITSITYPDGSVTEYEYAHQEGSFSDARNCYGALGVPNIEESASGYNLGDANGDGRIVGGRQVSGVNICNFGVVREELPDLTIRGPQGYPGATTIEREKLIWYDDAGNRVRFKGIDGIWLQNFYSPRKDLIRNVLDPDGLNYQIFKAYDDKHRVIEERGPDGSRKTFGYDKERLAWSREHSSDGTQDLYQPYFYGRNNLIITSVKPRYISSTEPTPTYDENLVINEPNGLVRQDPNGLVREAHQFIKDSSGMEDAVTTFTYTGDGLPYETHYPNGAIIRNFYDAHGNVIQRIKTDASGANYGSETLIYDEHGNVLKSISSVDSDGNGYGDEMSYEYDSYGNVKRVTDEIGTANEFDYNINGDIVAARVLSSDGQLLGSAQAQYDEDGRAVRVVQQRFSSDGQQLNPFEYVKVYGRGISDELLFTVIDPNGISQQMNYGYDALGRRIAVYSGTDNTVGAQTTLDPAGRVMMTRFIHDGSTSSEINPPESTIRNIYDGLKRLTKKIDPLRNTLIYEYDARGLVRSVTDALGNKKEFEYDSLGRLIHERQIGADIAQNSDEAPVRDAYYKYDLEGNLIEVTDYLGKVTQYQYDIFGRQIGSSQNGEFSSSVVYDNKDRVRQTQTSSSTQTYTYDPADRLIDSSATGNVNVNKHFDYDVLGNLITASVTTDQRPVVTTSATYSSLGEPLTETVDITGVTQRTFSFGYDSAGRTAGINYPSMQIEYVYDSHGRLQEIDKLPTSTVAGQIVSRCDIFYGNVGCRQASLYSGAIIQNDFDARGLTLRNELIDNTGQIMLGYQSQFDELARLKTRTRSTDNMRETFGYDEFGRLNSWTRDNGNPVTTTWSYDLADNILSKQVGKQQAIIFNIDNSNYQLLSATPILQSVSYGADGEETGRVLQSGNSVNTEYNAELMPWKKTVANVSGTTASQSVQDYTYDAFGNQVMRNGAGQNINIFVNGMLLEEYDGQGWKEYVPGHGVIWREMGGTSDYLQIGMGGNIMGVHDGQRVNAQYEYEPYGGLLDSQTGQALTNLPNVRNSKLLYMGAYGTLFDSLDNSHRTAARDYDFSTGRFKQMDPIGLSGGFNSYSYTSGDPINLVDPSGLSGERTPGGGYEVPDYLNNDLFNLPDLEDDRLLWTNYRIGLNYKTTMSDNGRIRLTAENAVDVIVLYGNVDVIAFKDIANYVARFLGNYEGYNSLGSANQIDVLNNMLMVTSITFGPDSEGVTFLQNMIKSTLEGGFTKALARCGSCFKGIDEADFNSQWGSGVREKVVATQLVLDHLLGAVGGRLSAGGSRASKFTKDGSKWLRLSKKILFKTPTGTKLSLQSASDSNVMNVPKYVFRSGSRGTEKIIKAGGIFPAPTTIWNEASHKLDWMSHTKYPHGQWMVSTTDHFAKFIRGNTEFGGDWVFTIRTKGLWAFDVNKAYALKGLKNAFAHEGEIKILGGIPIKNIIGARFRVNGKFVGRFIRF